MDRQRALAELLAAAAEPEVQRDPDWVRKRARLLGASESAQARNLSNYGTAAELRAAKAEARAAPAEGGDEDAPRGPSVEMKYLYFGHGICLEKAAELLCEVALQAPLLATSSCFRRGRLLYSPDGVCLAEWGEDGLPRFRPGTFSAADFIAAPPAGGAGDAAGDASAGSFPTLLEIKSPYNFRPPTRSGAPRCAPAPEHRCQLEQGLVVMEPILAGLGGEASGARALLFRGDFRVCDVRAISAGPETEEELLADAVAAASDAAAAGSGAAPWNPARVAVRAAGSLVVSVDSETSLVPPTVPAVYEAVGRGRGRVVAAAAAFVPEPGAPGAAPPAMSWAEESPAGEPAHPLVRMEWTLGRCDWAVVERPPDTLLEELNAAASWILGDEPQN